MTRRGDVVMVEFPYTDAAHSKVRPAVVVPNDRDNQRLRKTVVAMITGNLRRRGDPSHLFIDPATEPSSGVKDHSNDIPPPQMGITRSFRLTPTNYATLGKGRGQRSFYCDDLSKEVEQPIRFAEATTFTPVLKCDQRGPGNVRV